MPNSTKVTIVVVSAAAWKASESVRRTSRAWVGSVQATGVEEALETLGEVLVDQDQHVELAVVVGGLAPLPTARTFHQGSRRRHVVIDGEYRRAQPFPEFLAAAVRDVAEATGLGPDRLNPGPVDFEVL